MLRKRMFLSSGVMLLILLVVSMNISGAFAQGATATPTPMLMETENPPPLRDNMLLQDTSLLDSDTDCQLPCWHGIMPGETSWEDALATLEADSSIENLAIQESDETTAKSAEFQQQGGMLCCQVFTQDGETVSVIFLRIAPNMTLGEFFEVHGEPQYAIGSHYSADQSVMNLIYPDQSLIIYTFVAGEAASLSENSELVGALYMNQPDMELLVATSNLYIWKGYQPFSRYYEAPYDHELSITLTPTPS